MTRMSSQRAARRVAPVSQGCHHQRRRRVPGWLVALVDRIVLESGNSTGFDAAAWTAEWLATENAALGGKKPIDSLSTSDGRDLVKALVLRMQSGAYS